MSREQLASQGINIDKIAEATYDFIRQKYGHDLADEAIARSGYCVDAGPQMTARLPHEKLRALGFRAVNICSKIEEPLMIHHYTALVGNTDASADIIVDATYGQFLPDSQELVFVGTRARAINLIESNGLDPQYARLYTSEAILE